MRGLHRALLLTTLAGIPSVAYAQEQQTPIDPPQKTILAASIAELPLELDARGRPVVVGRINGQGPYRLAIDWGANAFAISESVVQDLALSTEDITFDNGQEVKASSIDSLVLGEATLEGLSAIVCRFSRYTRDQLGRRPRHQCVCGSFNDVRLSREDGAA